jgi:hypothetical protein
MQGPMDWYESVGVELAVTWGTVSRFQWEVRNMRFTRATTCWLEGTQDDLRDRRRAVLGIARGVIDSKTAADLELDSIWPMIPVDTISPRLANLICIAYKDPPERTFSKSSDGTEDDNVNKGFDDLYDSLNINEVMDQAYRAALFTNTVLILWSDDEQKFLVLTPEYFRISEDGIWIARRTGYTDAERRQYHGRDAVTEGEIVYDVWNNKTHEVRNHSGALIMSQCEDNPWGMFPGVLMKLIPSNDLFGAGITEVAEINAATNLIGLFELRVALYYGFPIAVGTNIRNDSGGSSAKNNLNMGPGKMLNLQDPDGSVHPDFKFVSPGGQFSDLQEFKRKKISAFIRNQDLPGFLVDESLSPPSGVALQVLEDPLNRVRQKHLPALRRTERTLVEFIEKLAKTMKRPTLVVENFEINYADAQGFIDPAEELAFDMQKAANGLTTPSAIIKKYLNVQRGTTDEAAVAMMQKNKQLLSFLTPPEIKESIKA